MKLGQKELTIDKQKYNYIGELDPDDNACGKGVAILASKKKNWKYVGTFFKNQLHGIGRLIYIFCYQFSCKNLRGKRR